MADGRQAEAGDHNGADQKCIARQPRGRGQEGKVNLTMYTQTGKNRFARLIVSHLRACSPQTGPHVRSSTVHPVSACARPHLAHCDAFFPRCVRACAARRRGYATLDYVNLRIAWLVSHFALMQHLGLSPGSIV